MGDYMGRVKENLEDRFGITFFNVATTSTKD
jgi:hypothetical protein